MQHDEPEARPRDFDGWHLSILATGGLVGDFAKTACVFGVPPCTVSAMHRKVGLVFAALALFSIAGGQWAVLQSVAWVGMLHDYTQRTGSFTIAVEQTFDGEHPCELCRGIVSAMASEQKEKPAVPGAKDDAKVKATVADSVLLPLTPQATRLAWIPAAPLFGPSRAAPPPTPPPRGGAVAA